MNEIAPRKQSAEEVLAVIRERKRQLLEELEELVTAEKVYQELSDAVVFDRSENADPIPDKPDAPCPADARRKRGPSFVLSSEAFESETKAAFSMNTTMRQATIRILSRAPSKGMSAQSLRASLENLGWDDVKPTSLASLLTRLKNEGAVDNINRKWRLRRPESRRSSHAGSLPTSGLSSDRN